MSNRNFYYRFRGVSGIYLITNKVTGNAYVGASCNVGQRWLQHLTCNTLPVQKDIQEKGIENFKFEVLERVSRENLAEREEYWIKELSPFYNKDEKGGYPSFSGCKGKHKSEQGRRNIAEANRRKAKNPEYLKHMSEALKGRKYHQKQPRPRPKWKFPDGSIREMSIQNAHKCYLNKGVELVKLD